MESFKDLVLGKAGKKRKGSWGVMSKKRVVRIKRTKEALKRKAYRSKN